MVKHYTLSVILLLWLPVGLLLPPAARAGVPASDWIQVGEEVLRTPTLVVTPDGTSDPEALARAFVEFTDPIARLDEKRIRERRDEIQRERVRARSSERDSELIIRWLAQTIEFVRGFAGGRENWINKDFEARYRQRMKWEWTEKQGWFWVVSVSQSSFWTEHTRVERRSAGTGLELPLIGNHQIELRSGEGQLLLRVLPLAATYRKLLAREAYQANYERISGSGIGAMELTPGVELDGAVHWSGDFRRVTTGARVLTQNWVTDDQLFRVIAEVYLRVDLNVGRTWVRDMSVVPRCIFEHYHENGGEKLGEILRGSLLQGESVIRCFMTLEFVLGP